MYIIQPMQKKSKPVQKMISYASQYSLPVGGLSKDSGNGHGTHHRTKNDEEVSLPQRSGSETSSSFLVRWWVPCPLPESLLSPPTGKEYWLAYEIIFCTVFDFFCIDWIMYIILCDSARSEDELARD